MSTEGRRVIREESREESAVQTERVKQKSTVCERTRERPENKRETILNKARGARVSRRHSSIQNTKLVPQ